MSELWGIQSGQSQRLADDQAQGLFGLRMAEGAVTLEQQRFALSNAKDMLAKQQQAQKLIEAGNAKAKSTGDPTLDTASMLFRIGQADMQAGLIEDGTASIVKAATLQENHARIVESQTKNQIAKYGFISSLAEGVHDQDTLDQAKMIYQAQFPEDKLPPVFQQPYNAKLVDQVKQGALTQLDKAKIEAEKGSAAERRAAAARDYAETTRAKAQVSEIEQRTKNLAKVGGETKLPSKQETDSVAAMIKADSGPDVDKNSVEVTAQKIAEEAKNIAQQTGKSMRQAQEEAYGKAKARGDLSAVKATSKTQQYQDQSLALIDELIDSAEKSKGKILGVTGLGGYASRAVEVGKNVLGSDDTEAATFASKMNELRLLIPKALGTGVARYKMAEIEKVTRGLSPGDTADNTISALKSLKESMTGRKEGEVIPLEQYLDQASR